MNRMGQNCILILVAAYFTLVGAADREGINCKDKDGASCARDRDDFPYYDPEDVAERAEKWIYISIGITVAVLVAIGVFIASCLFCAVCPAYKYRHKNGVVYGTTIIQQQPAPVHPQPAYNPHQPNLHPSLQSSYPGVIYSPGQAPPKIQPANEPYYNTAPEYKQDPGTSHTAGQAPPQIQPANEPYYNTVPEYKQDPGTSYTAGQAPPQMQPANEPYYYSTVPEYKQNPGAGHTAGVPGAQPPYNPNPPPY